MKISFANNFYYLRGGAERVFFDEILWLVQKGNKIIPFSRQSPKNSKTTYAHFFLPVIDYENLNFVNKTKAAFNIIYSLPIKKRFASLLDQEQPDLVHGHNIYGGLSYSIVDAAKDRGVPFVLTLHDLKLACPSYLMLHRGEICDRCGTGNFWHCITQSCHKNSLSASIVNTAEAYFNKIFRKYGWIHRFLCPSQFLLEKIANAGIPRNKLVYLPNALNPMAYEPNYSKGKYALFAGRLSREKGVLTLLKALKHLRIPLRIAGTGPLESECKAFVATHNMHHVAFEGHCQGEKLKDLFQQAAFLIIPSEWYENAPMSILEAFAYGKPAIGSRLGGIPEQIIQDETGLLFEAGNAQELAESVAELWSNPSKIQRMGINARRRIETEFCSDLHVKRLLEIYSEVVTR